ncbi:MAG TPA: GGDEF domain-containing response regulator [Pyrinomonadaceae bacterium]|jgi:diguanylate cyclase (GGDEF)-like protein
MSAIARAVNNDRTQSRDQGRVLLVTDDPAMNVYTEALERAGFVVVGVAGGVAALVSLQRTRPHVVIADVNLKGIRADELARMLGQAEDILPLILIGADDSSGARRAAALASGAFDYISMPSEQSLLMARTSQLVAFKQTMDRLRAEADRDYLTGLANRRRFRTALGQEVERWRRYNVPCSLLLVDIDFLKKINDAHGHSAGDVVIRHVASALVELSRDNDTAARLGGEEFALLLAGADDKKALAAAERLRYVISHEPLEGIGVVTVSLGVAACPMHARSERTLYAASDVALYRAKNEGRDRSALAPAFNPAQTGVV